MNHSYHNTWHEGGIIAVERIASDPDPRERSWTKLWNVGDRVRLSATARKGVRLTLDMRDQQEAYIESFSTLIDGVVTLSGYLAGTPVWELADLVLVRKSRFNQVTTLPTKFTKALLPAQRRGVRFGDGHLNADFGFTKEQADALDHLETCVDKLFNSDPNGWTSVKRRQIEVIKAYTAVSVLGLKKSLTAHECEIIDKCRGYPSLSQMTA